MGVKHPEYVLAAAVACCAPMIPGILADEISAVSAGERFLAALVVCWILGSILSGVYSRYSAQVQRTQILRLIESENDVHQDALQTTAEVVAKPEA